MKVILSGGGTGGHIYPAVAIADQIRRLRPEAEILFVGTEKGMERELVPQSGYPIRFITVSGFDRHNLLKSVKTMADLRKGLHEAKKILREERPDLVIGTGGYVCGPVVRTAARMGIPCYLHEQNALPGMTNRMLEKEVRKIFISFAEGAEHFQCKEKLIVTGNPVRAAFFETDPAACRARLGLGPEDFFLLCFGGSRGAGRINEVMLESLPRLLDVPGMRVCFITGKYYYDEIEAKLREQGLLEREALTLMPYASEIQDLMAAADLLISRAGALTVSEITACGKVSIFIPSPNVTGNHQYFNAKVVADRGGGLLLEEKDLSAETLCRSVLGLAEDREELARMAQASASLGIRDAAAEICRHLPLAE